MNKWVIGGGIAAAAVAGYLLLKRGAAAQSTPAQAQDGSNIQQPALMYIPANTGDTAGFTSGYGTQPLTNLLSGNGAVGSTNPLATFLSNYATASTAASINQTDTAALANLTLSPGASASITHGAGGSTLSITPAPTDPNAYNPKYSSADIKNFIGQQAGAGVPINAASVQAWSKQYNVPISQIAAAYGMTPEAGQAWLSANPGKAA